MKSWRAFALVFVPAMFSSAVAAQSVMPRSVQTEAVVLPGADSCAAARVITAVPYADIAETWSATKDASDPASCRADLTARSLWYEFTPATTANYRILTTRSSAQARASIYSGSCGALVSVGCTSTPRLFAGTTYKIMVTSADGDQPGTLVVHLCPAPVTPVMTVGTVCPGSSGNIASVPDPGDGSTFQWSIGPGSIRSGQGTPSVTFDVPSGMSNDSVTLNVTVTPPSGCPSTALKIIPVGAGSITTEVVVTPGSTKNVASVPHRAGMVYTWGITNGTIESGQGTGSLTYTAGASGSVGLSLITGPWNCIEGVASSASVPIQPISALTDSCASPHVVPSLPYRDVQDISTATAEAGDVLACFPELAPPKTIWYEYTPQSSGPFTVHTVGSTPGTGSIADERFDTVLTAYTGECASRTEVACNVDASRITPFINQSVITVQGVAGTKYRVMSGLEYDAAATRSKLQTAFHAGGVGSVQIATSPSGCAGGQGTASVPDGGAGAKYYWSSSELVIVSGQGTRNVAFILGRQTTAALGVAFVSATGALSIGFVTIRVDGSAAITAPQTVGAGVSATASVAVTDEGTYSWSIQNGTITSAADGPVVTFTSGTSGVVTLTVAVNAGCGPTQIAMKDLLVTPPASLSSCSYDLSPAMATFHASGGTGAIQVVASEGCSWSAIAPPGGFITITGGGSSPGPVSFSVAANAGVTRTSAIAVGATRFEVVQHGSAGSMVLDAVASATQVALSWTPVTGAVAYDVMRRSSADAFAMVFRRAQTSYVDATVAPGRGYLYRVRAINWFGETIANSNVDLAVPFSFTDPLLGPGTVAKAAHFSELRSAINAMRAALNWTTLAYGAGLAGGQPITAAHMAELRSALAAARSAAGLGPIVFMDSTLMPGTTPLKASHVVELRNGIK